MSTLSRRLYRFAVPVAFIFTLIVAGAPGSGVAQDAVLPSGIQEQLQTIMQLDNDAELITALQTLIEENPDLAADIAGAAAEARPDLAVEIFLAAAEVAPEATGDIANAVANAAPDLAEAVYAELSNIQTAGGRPPIAPPPHVRKILKGTLENPNVVSPSG